MGNASTSAPDAEIAEDRDDVTTSQEEGSMYKLNQSSDDVLLRLTAHAGKQFARYKKEQGVYLNCHDQRRGSRCRRCTREKGEDGPYMVTMCQPVSKYSVRKIKGYLADFKNGRSPLPVELHDANVMYWCRLSALNSEKNMPAVLDVRFTDVRFICTIECLCQKRDNAESFNFSYNVLHIQETMRALVLMAKGTGGAAEALYSDSDDSATVGPVAAEVTCMYLNVTQFNPVTQTTYTESVMRAFGEIYQGASDAIQRQGYREAVTDKDLNPKYRRAQAAFHASDAMNSAYTLSFMAAGVSPFHMACFYLLHTLTAVAMNSEILPDWQHHINANNQVQIDNAQFDPITLRDRTVAQKRLALLAFVASKAAFESTEIVTAATGGIAPHTIPDPDRILDPIRSAFNRELSSFLSPKDLNGVITSWHEEASRGGRVGATVHFQDEVHWQYIVASKMVTRYVKDHEHLIDDDRSAHLREMKMTDRDPASRLSRIKAKKQRKKKSRWSSIF